MRMLSEKRKMSIFLIFETNSFSNANNFIINFD